MGTRSCGSGVSWLAAGSGDLHSENMVGPGTGDDQPLRVPSDSEDVGGRGSTDVWMTQVGSGGEEADRLDQAGGTGRSYGGLAATAQGYRRTGGGER
jgi:hypothetical protein